MIGVKFSDAKRNAEFNEAVGNFVSEVVFGEPGRVSNYSSLAVHDRGRLIAGVLYHNYYPREGVIELSAGAIDRRWMTRPVLKAIFAVPFDIFRCQLAAIRVSERNRVMIDIARGLGFVGYLIPRLRGRDHAEWLMTLTEEDWRAHPINKRQTS